MSEIIWYSKGYMHPNVYSSIINNSQIMERAQMSINRWMDKDDVGFRKKQECGVNMGKQKKPRKYATMKWMLSLQNQRLKEKDRLKPKKKEKKDPSARKGREVPRHPSCLFFQYNTQLGPPYHILVDTNFINFSIKAKLDLVQSMMDCLYA